MIALKFSRERIAEFLDCLHTGKPIKGVNNAFDFLMLAGACQFAALSHGPHGYTAEQFTALHLERREAAEEGFQESLTAAIEFCSMLAMKVQDDEYELPPNFAAIIKVIDDKKEVNIVRSM